MNREIMAIISAIMLLLSSCIEKTKPVDQAVKQDQTQLPSEVMKAIKEEFPGALPYRVAIDSLLRHLAKNSISPNQILWGQSTCVDDITNTKNKLVHPEIKGPFTIGGLGGIPFTGVTGLDAFAHHVPDEGTAVLFVGPHIGYRAEEGWGKILRHGQHHSSSCCGALSAALNKLQKTEIKKESPSEDDYQEQFIEQLALRRQREILPAKQPLVALTKVVSQEAEERMTKYVKQVKERHFDYAVVVVGTIINTDYLYDDYLRIEHISIKDIKKNVWIEQK